MLNGKKLVALLPIKANSERVRGKNFRDFSGKPLYRWILETLLDIGEIDQVVINTDARTLLEKSGLVESERLLVRDRSQNLQGDSVSMNLILRDDINTVESDIYLMTHATNPLLSKETILSALNYFDSLEGHDSLFSVNRIQTRFYRENMSAVNHDPKVLIPTQELESWYEENSCLYVFTEHSFMRTGARIGQSPQMYLTPRLESVDIDVEDDWFMAEAIASKLMGSK